MLIDSIQDNLKSSEISEILRSLTWESKVLLDRKMLKSIDLEMKSLVLPNLNPRSTTKVPIKEQSKSSTKRTAD